jgi:transcriptional regulator with XRE-family HTH domain
MLRTGRKISGTCLWKIRTGRDGNPTLSVLTALASFFRISLAFFEDKGEDLELDADRAALYTLGNMRGDSLELLRALSELRTDERAFADAVIKALAHRTWEGPERGAMVSVFSNCSCPLANSRSRHVR